MKRSPQMYQWAAVLLVLPVTTFAQDMDLSNVLIPGENWQEVASGFRFTEAPAVDAEGNLYFADVPASKILRLTASNELETFVAESKRTSGLMFAPDDRLIGCQGESREIVAYDSEGKSQTIASEIDGNDLVVAGDGGIYVTDFRNHQVWHVDPAGNKRVVDTGIDKPNGIILWPDQGTLVVADSGGKYLWTFRIQADGSLLFKQPYYACQLLPGREQSRADGMTVDVAGRLYVTTEAGLQMFDPIGRLGGVIQKPQNAFLSNVVFAGPQLDWLYVTCGDKVFRRKTKTQGVRYQPR